MEGSARVSAPARPRRPAATPAAPAPASRVGAFVSVALVPVVVSYAAMVLVTAVVTGVAAGTTPGGEPGPAGSVAAAVPLWLAAHLVPVTLHGETVSALPLAPALAIGLLIAATTRRAVRRLGVTRAGGAVGVVATAVTAHAASGVLAAALLTPETVIDASPTLAGVVCGLLAGIAALAGVASPTGLTGRRVARLPHGVRAGMRSGLLGALGFLAAGAGMVTASLLADAPDVAGVFSRLAPEAGSGAGLALLTAAYLPNAVIGATSWIAGPGLAIGVMSTTPTSVIAGPISAMPPLPLAALLPTAAPPPWAGLTFAVPLALGSLVGWTLTPGAGDAPARLRTLGVAAVSAALPLGVLAVLAGGRLGTGPFDPVVVPAGALVLAIMAWVLVPGAVVVLAVGPVAPAPRRPPPGGLPTDGAPDLEDAEDDEDRVPVDTRPPEGPD